MGNENKAKRELVELDVAELSVVDSAAIEEKFIVIKCKNQEGQDMDKTEEVTKETGTPVEKENSVPEKSGSDAEKVSVEVEKASGEAVVAAMDKVASTVEGIAKQLGVEDTEKKLTPREVVEKHLKAAGLDEAALEKSLAAYDASTEMTKTPEVETPVVKAENEEASVEKSEEDIALNTLEVLEEAIAKAKRFTPAREDTLKSAVEQLQKLLAALQPTPSMNKQTPKNNLPSNAQVNEADLTTVTKQLEVFTDTITKALDEIKGTTNALNERVEGIEKARMPSKSVGGDSTDVETEVKKEKGLWGDVL